MTGVSEPAFQYEAIPAVIPADARSVDLALIVANRSGERRPCDAIRVALPAGLAAEDLSADPTSIEADAPPGAGWTITHEGGAFVAEPEQRGGGLGDGESLAIRFYGVVPNGVPGTAEIRILESSAGLRETTAAVEKRERGEVAMLAVEDGRPLFGYGVTPAAFPNSSKSVTLTVKVENRAGADRACAGIQFTLPAGLSDQLGSVQAAPTVGTPWAIRSIGGGVYVASPQPPTNGIAAGDSIGFTFTDLRPSGSPAKYDFTIEEAAGGSATLPLELTEPGLGITQFTATAVQVSPDTEVTLSWYATEATGCTLSSDRFTHPGPPDGSFKDRPPVTTTYTLTASGVGQPVQAQLTVTVARPQVLSFDVDPSAVVQGAPVKLTWETMHAAWCTLEFHPVMGVVEPPIVVPASSDGYVVNPLVSGSFALRAVANGQVDSRNLPVTIQPVAIKRFTSSPGTIAPGQAALLDWDTAYASSVDMSPEIGSVDAGGSREVRPASDSRYTLTANGGGGPLNRSVDVAVLPMLLSFKFEVVYSQVVFSWASSGATTATLQGEQVATSGSISLGCMQTTALAELILVSPMGARAEIAASAITAPEWIELAGRKHLLPWGGRAAVELKAPRGLALPGDQSVSWDARTLLPDASVKGVLTTPEGAPVGLGPAATGQADLALGDPRPGDEWLWKGWAEDPWNGRWRIEWTVLQSGTAQPPTPA